MDGEDGGHKGATPERAGQPAQGEEQEDGGGGMEQDIGEMMPRRIQAVELAVQHVGQGGQGMPVDPMPLGEGLDNPVPTEPPGDGGILVNVNIIVVVDELMVQGLAKDGPDGRGESKADGDREPRPGRWDTWLEGGAF